MQLHPQRQAGPFRGQQRAFGAEDLQLTHRHLRQGLAAGVACLQAGSPPGFQRAIRIEHPFFRLCPRIRNSRHRLQHNLRTGNARRLRAQRNRPRLQCAGNNRQQLAAEHPAACAFVGIVIGAVPVIQADQPSRSFNAELHPVIGVLDRQTRCICSSNRDEDQILPVSSKLLLVCCKHKGGGIAEGSTLLRGYYLTLIIIGIGPENPCLVRQLPVPYQLQAVFMVNIIGPLRHVIQEQLNPRRIGADTHINQLPF
ncbi:hypothetical protein D3C75_272040 [compost metagenome]